MSRKCELCKALEKGESEKGKISASDAVKISLQSICGLQI